MKKVMAVLITMLGSFLLFFSVNAGVQAATKPSVSISASLQGTYYYPNGESMQITRNTFQQSGGPVLKVNQIVNQKNGYKELLTGNSDPLIIKKASYGLSSLGFPGYIKMYAQLPQPSAKLVSSQYKKSIISYQSTKGVEVIGQDQSGRILFDDKSASGKVTTHKVAEKLQKGQAIIFDVRAQGRTLIYRGLVTN